MLDFVQTEDKHNICTSGMNQSIDLPYYITVPSPVQNVMVTREKQRKLNISWEEPEEPNDHTLNYTVIITDINTVRIELSKAVGEMDQLEVLSQPLGIYNSFFTLHRFFLFIENNTNQYACSLPYYPVMHPHQWQYIFVSLCQLCGSQDSGQSVLQRFD